MMNGIVSKDDWDFLETSVARSPTYSPIARQRRGNTFPRILFFFPNRCLASFCRIGYGSRDMSTFNLIFRSRPKNRLLSCIVGIFTALGLGVLTTHCTWDGLDAYSAQYGKALVDAGGGTGGSAGAGGSGGSPIDAGTCDCQAGQSCVLGQCETCLPIWSYDHKALRQGDSIIVDHHYDTSRKTVYVTASRQDGQAPRRGYLAEVHSCRGTKLRDFDGPTAVDGSAVPGLLMSGRAGDLLYARAAYDDPSKIAGYVVYDVDKGLFLRTVWVDPWQTGAAIQYAWGLDVSASGKVWMNGEITALAGDPPSPLVMQSDGAGKTCVTNVPSITGNGRAVVAHHGDVYLTMGTASPTPEVRVLHYTDSGCDVALCNCPIADELPALPVPGFPIIMDGKVLGSVLVIGGLYAKMGDDYGGFLAQFNFVTKSWGTVYTYDSTPLLDGVTALGGDGSTVYVAMAENYSFSDPAVAKMQVHALNFPISANSQPKLVPVTALRGAFAVDLDGEGFIMTGYSAGSIADGRTIRCTLEMCP